MIGFNVGLLVISSKTDFGCLPKEFKTGGCGCGCCIRIGSRTLFIGDLLPVAKKKEEE